MLLPYLRSALSLVLTALVRRSTLPVGVFTCALLLAAPKLQAQQVQPSELSLIDITIQDSTGFPLDSITVGDSIFVRVDFLYRGQDSVFNYNPAINPLSLTYFVDNLDSTGLDERADSQSIPLSQNYSGQPRDTFVFITDIPLIASANLFQGGENVIVIWPSGASIGPGDTARSDTFFVVDTTSPSSRPARQADWLNWRISAHQELILRSQTPLASVRIVDLNGRLLLYRELNGREATLPSLPKGVLWLDVRNQRGERSQWKLWQP